MSTGPNETAAPTPERPRPGASSASAPRVRHLRAHVVIVVWLALALITATTQHTLPVAHWLAIHLFLLGAVTTAIMVWTEHFAVAMLHAPPPDPRWGGVRLIALNVSAVAVLTGVAVDWPVLAGVGTLGVVAAIIGHVAALVRLGRGALGGRLAPVVGYYRLAGVALIAGAVLGGLLATGALGEAGRTGVELAHIHVNLLGWVGLPIVGTLFMLWPTVLGVRMEDRTVPVARRVLWLTGLGLLLAVPALLLGARWPAVAGLAVYAVGVGWASALFLRTVLRRAPRSGASWMLAAATCWLVVGVVADLGLMATRELSHLDPALHGLLPVLLIGFVGQTLLGALTYLLPVVLSGGPTDRAALADLLDWGWRTRLVVLNAGVLLLFLPLPAPVGAVGFGAAAAAFAAFLGLAAAALVRSREGAVTGGAGGAAAWRAPLAGAGIGVLLIVFALVAAGLPAGTTSGGGGSGTAATGTRTVEVELKGMAVSPSRIEVAPGTVLRLEVVNRDTQRHDLRVEDGPRTPMLGEGESHLLEVGPIAADLEAWCTVPGHRAAGMSMTIAVTGSADGGAESEPGHGHASPDGLDPAAEHSDGWEPRSAVLPPAEEARVHEVELRAVEADIEVAPGVSQRMWTFGGTAPGPTLRGKVGDVFEVTLVNDAEMGHGIDFHAGALAPDEPMRTIGPGERLVYRFTAERAGAWLYHCSTPSMLQHIGNGMYGAVIIDPPDLEQADREYVLVSSQLYLGEPGSEGQVAKMREGRPDAWVFNGGAGQYAAAPLAARAEERVRFWVVAAGPSDGIAFHIVGTVFDSVYKEGAHLVRPDDPGGAQVLDLAAAQGGYVEAVFPEPGHYALVDHDMRRAEAGAHGIVKVTP
ncbi:nitrite reductase (NO-forming) [Nocardiopsis mwathae]|uniref:Copper-containing nitrite reductase n=1 Tax=Nocardiopsis mwathae TaxID=1472723 RepID=A0A7X0D7M2_9ACTN|nr:nitrite reductase (NO-forming) [Nocardiopsis mwathae]